MRTFELALVSLLAVSAVWGLVIGARGRTLLSVLLAAVLLLLVLHLVFEGVHWQMAPAYLGVLLLAGVVFYRNPANTPPPIGAWAIIVLVLLTVVASVVFPMFRLPRPTGPYAVGTQVMYLVDSSREEEHNPGRRRELAIQLWYPAQASRNPYASYRMRRETTLVSSYQSVLRTHSRWKAPVAVSGDAFPVLLFNPAWNGRRTQNTYLVEDLASHGYVVVGIDHPYNSAPVAFPDGRVIGSVPVPEMDFATNNLETIEAAAQKELTTQTADTLFVLDRLQAMNADPKSAFYDRLDTHNVGALGHSFGGAVSAEAAYLDPRIRAALDLDGSLFGEVQRQGLHKPFMFIEEDVPHYAAEELARLDPADRIVATLNDRDTAMFKNSEGYRIFLHGSSHMSFTDRALFSPFKSLSHTGEIRPRREFHIIREYALAFFDQVLRGHPSPLLESGQSPIPEAAFQANPAPVQ